jgi:response regulator RpfG family c-di-GMP phosphodiesterase
MIQVLYLDDELHNLTAFRAAFRRDFQVHVTTEPTEAVELLRSEDIEVIISDQKMPTISGVEFFELITGEFPDPVRMLLTGHADMDAVIDAINKGQIYKYIAKPWNEAELRGIVQGGSKIYRARKADQDQSKRLLRSFDEALALSGQIVEQLKDKGETGCDGPTSQHVMELAMRIHNLLDDPSVEI